MTSVGKFIYKLVLIWMMLIGLSIFMVGVQTLTLKQDFAWFMQEAYLASASTLQFCAAGSIVLAFVLGVLGAFAFILVLLCMDKE